MYKFDPFIDDTGIMRVGGRFRRANTDQDMKHPGILPKKSHDTDLIICLYHKMVLHQGGEITLNEIQSSRFRIIGGSSAVSNHFSKFIVFRKIEVVTENG